ncbi:heavy metal translocating P-type ATPase [Thioclava sp. GXIMD4216]|uniref:heavy metal translocating P-type ATPase n=1 Tax=Thioclava sp. GXIMD4216 TaxID=3131929 RepID=UPI0030D3DB9F
MTELHTRFIVDGMHCGACTGRVERALLAVPGVRQANANLMARNVTLHFDSPTEGGPASADLARSLEAAGYPIAEAEADLASDTDIPAELQSRARDTLLAHPAILSVETAARQIDVRYAQGAIAPSEMVRLLAPLGLEAKPRKAETPPPDRAHKQADETRKLRRDVIVSAALTLPVFILAMGSHLIPGMHHLIEMTIGERLSWVIQLVLTTLVLLGPGRIFLTLGLPALQRGAPEMNSLVALGALAAWGYSTLVTLVPYMVPESARGVYFEAAATIVTLILLGRWFEARAKGRAGEAISRLVGLRPDTARVERGEQIIDLPVAELAAGDLVHLPPGARVAADGIVTEGQGWIDEAMLTGEAAPVEKSEGSSITGGTVNGTVPLVYRVTATGTETVLARIIAMVEEAQGGKLPVQALVDRVTRVFVPVVIGLSLLTFLIWMIAGQGFTHALVAGISVMIIACPCAMGLATPVSILVGTGRAAEMGLLFRRGDALQRLAEVKTIAFDKTGTLTEGRPVLSDLIAAPDSPPATETLRLAAGIEARSEHPLAHAILQGTETRGLVPAQAKRVRSQTGRGLTGEADGHKLVIGNAAALNEHGIATDTLSDQADALAAKGKTPIWIGIDGQLAALMAVSDPIKPQAVETVQALEKAHVETAMISGDLRRTAQSVAQGLGIGTVVAEVLPDGKVAAIEDMKRKGTTAFVGDGINDAPALAAADIGIAIGTGTDVAIETAEVVLMQGDPRSVGQAVHLSRAVMRNIRENLFWAFAYNAALIPVAMGVLVPFGGPGMSPLLAAAAMAFSSTFVVTNALRLRRLKL